MKQGKSRFDYQLNKLATLTEQAAAQENPALWLFANDMRTPLFMLESLSRLYASWHNKKSFTKLKDTFKALEDGLGAVDYYAAFAKEFAENAAIPATITAFLTKRKEEEARKLNKILKADDWLNGKRLKKINAKLTEADWLNDAEETVLLAKFYEKQIVKINEFIHETHYVFKDIEAQVHELRRLLRWLSIYPQALRGAIALKKTRTVLAIFKPYLTPEVINSPFNKLPVSETGKPILLLDQNHFLALSWLIRELGKIKDKGLKINVIAEALQNTEGLKLKAATQKALTILGADYPTTDKLLHEASGVVKAYFEAKLLNGLVGHSTSP
jgi:hypothetical protein